MSIQDDGDNAEMTAQQCAAWLGWGSTRAAARRLTDRLKRREKGRGWFERDGTGGLRITKRQIAQHAPDLLRADYQTGLTQVSKQLDEIHQRLDRVVDRRIAKHPMVQRHERKIAQHSRDIAQLTEVADKSAKALARILDLEP